MPANSEWKCVLVPMVRVLINDIDETTYDNPRLEKVIIVAAQLLKPEFDFATTYTSNIRTQTISPDPVDNNDDAFINFVSMKSALLILEGELKNLASGAIKVQDGPASIDMSGAYNATKDAYEKLLDAFNRAKLAYTLGNVSEIKAIFSAYASPYTSNFCPSIQYG